MTKFILLPRLRDYTGPILADNPGLWFRFGEPSGTTAINEIGAVDGTYFGTFSLGAAGAVRDGDTAVDLSWSTGRVGGTSIPVTGAPVTTWSVEVWADSDTTGPGYGSGPGVVKSGIFFDMGGGSQTRFQWFYATEGNLGNFGIYNNNGASFPTFGSNTGYNGSYHHYALVVNGTNADMYIDGASFGGTIALGGTIPLQASIPTLVVGANFFGNQGFFDGRMDEFIMYDQALSGAQILAHYNAGL